MSRAFFRRQFQFMQSRINDAKQRGIFARIFAWFMLGIFLIIGISIFIVVLLLSWLLIPIHLWRQRRRFQQTQQRGNGTAPRGNTIEGDVIDKKED